jgi:hypothetical protein
MGIVSWWSSISQGNDAADLIIESGNTEPFGKSFVKEYGHNATFFELASPSCRRSSGECLLVLWYMWLGRHC